jgi:hypothetical protein
MGSFTFVVKFRGMCAFVPRIDGKRAWVFLRNLNELKEEETRGRDIDGHRAVIKIRRSDLQLGSDIPDGTVIVWPLAYNDVRILPGGCEPRKDDLDIIGFWDSEKLDLTRPDATNPNSFSWVAPLEKASVKVGNPPGGGRIKEELLPDNLNPNDASELAARVHLQSGTLKTTQRGIKNDQYVVWRLRSYSRGLFGWLCSWREHRQILASEVSLEMTVPYDFVRLQLKDIQTGGIVDFDLYPAGDSIIIHIINEEGEQLLGGRLPDIKRGRPRDQDAIFESFYQKISQRPPSSRRLPIPVADSFVGAVGTDDGAYSAPPCSPGKMEAVREV